MSAFVPVGHVGLRDAIDALVDGMTDGKGSQAPSLEEALVERAGRQRLEAEAWRLVRSALLFGKLPSFALSARNGLVPIPPRSWGALGPTQPPETVLFDAGGGLEDMAVLLPTADFLHFLQGEQAVAEGAGIAALGDDHSAGITSTARAETACQRWLEEQMLVSPKRRPKTRPAFQAEAVKKFPISKRGFSRAWDKALSETGANWMLQAPRP